MRKFKTSKKPEARATYIYYGADGTKHELKPNVDGVTEMHIAMLHQEDDAEFDAQRREDYHVPVHYQAYLGGDGESADDRNDYVVDESLNPEQILIDAEECLERNSSLKAVWDKLLPQQRELLRKKAAGLTNTDIAGAEGVSEAAIRNRLTKIQRKAKNFI